MANILDIYKRYKITDNLQEHQLRVAAVAKQICDNFKGPLDKEAVVKACLLHDMGNILKFDFSVPAHFFEPEGVEYWKKVRAETAKHYGTQDEHQATIMIAKELGVGQRVIECIDAVGFSQSVQNAASSDMEAKICDNADMRATPDGVVSVKERLEEGRLRYKNRPDKWVPPGKWDELSNACYEVEKQVFEHCKIKPADITDESVGPIIEQLRSYEI